jgi:hypothetical protein
LSGNLIFLVGEPDIPCQGNLIFLVRDLIFLVGELLEPPASTHKHTGTHAHTSISYTTAILKHSMDAP